MLEWLTDPNNAYFWILIISILVGVIALIGRNFATYIKFVYPNAKYEAIGNPYVNEKELDRLWDTNSLNAFKDTLNSSKDYNIEGENTFEIQQSLDDNLQETISMMKKDSNKKIHPFFDLYLKKMDIYHVKNEVKRKIKNIPGRDFEGRVFLPETQKIVEKIRESEVENLPKILQDFGLSEEIVETLEKDVDFSEFDNQIDRYVIEKFREVKVTKQCNKAKQRYVNTMLDILNVKNVLRGKQLGMNKEEISKLFLGDGQEIAKWKFKELADVDQVPQVITGLEGTSYYGVLKDAIEIYHTDRSVQILENRLDGLFLKLVKDISLANYVTIGPTLRFVVSKEFEIKNLKIIAKGVGEKLPPNIIKSFTIREAG